MQGSVPKVPFVLAMLLGAVGRMPRRGRGRLRCAAGEGPAARRSARWRSRSPRRRTSSRDRSSPGPSTRRRSSSHAGSLGPIDLTHLNRSYYYFTLAALVIVLVARRPPSPDGGIGRTIIGVRENEPAASALTVSPRRAKLTAFAVAGFVAGLGGAILGGLVVTIGFPSGSSRVEDSLILVALAVIGGLGQPRRRGHRRVLGGRACPRSGRTTRPCRCSPRASGCSSSCSTSPAGSPRSATGSAARCLNWLEKRLPEVADEDEHRATGRRCTRRSVARSSHERGRQRDLAPPGSPCCSAGSSRSTPSTSASKPGEVIGLIGTNGAGKSTLLNAIGGYVPSDGPGRAARPGRLERSPAHRAPARGPGPHVPGRDALPRADRARDRAARARGPPARRRSGDRCCTCPARPAPSGRSATEAAELIDFLGLGRYADRFIAELSTGTRRIVELACGPRASRRG